MVGLIARAVCIFQKKKTAKVLLADRYREIKRIDRAEIDREKDEFYEIRREEQKENSALIDKSPRN